MNQEEINIYFSKHLSVEFSEREIQQMARIYFEDKGFSDIARLDEDIQELKHGKPIQQITGQEYFFDRKFKVNNHVLIPRPETEELVYWIITDYQGQDSVMRCIDIGTGSGIIPIILKSNFPYWQLYANDISEEALIVANENAIRHEVDINFIHLDFLNANIDFESRFDIIVSNPPYITEDESGIMQGNVLNHEPHLALFAKNAQDFYNRICEISKSKLTQSGSVYVELNEHYAEQTKEVFQQYFEQVELKLDLQGKKRMLRAKHQLS